MSLVVTEVGVHDEGLRNLLEQLTDDTTMLMIHQAFAKRCDPYVPMLNGPLHESGLAGVTPQYVEYNVPYAHYQYVGQNFNHTLDYHPKATAYWDKVMLEEQGEIFTKELEAILAWRAMQINGS